MHYFHNFSSEPHFLLGTGDLEGRIGSFSSFGVCLATTTKKRSSTFFRKKCTIPEKILVYAYEFAHPWKKSCWRPC